MSATPTNLFGSDNSHLPELEIIKLLNDKGILQSALRRIAYTGPNESGLTLHECIQVAREALDRIR